MKRIDTATKAVDLFGAGKHGFKNGNKALGIAATDFDADWPNHLQEEIANVIEGAGIALDGAQYNQLYLAIQQLIINNGAIKTPVRVASTAAINLAAPGANIDGVAMVAGDRFLEKDNGTAADRGIYIWNGAAVPATRATDADGVGELVAGMLVMVQEGTTNADTLWELSTDGVITIGTTALTFSRKDSNTVYASDAEAQALSILTKALSPGTLKTAFQGANQSIGTNGYQKLPGGLILQWGQVGTNGSGDSAVTFPTAFPNGVRAFTIGTIGSGAGYMGVFNTLTNVGVNVGTWSAAATRAGTTVHWLAIGN